MRIIDMRPALIIHHQSRRAARLMTISPDDERRIYRRALQECSSGASLGGIIGRVYSESVRCAKIGGKTA